MTEPLFSLSYALSFLLAHAGVALEFTWALLSGMLAPLLGAKLVAAALPAGAGAYVVGGLLLVASGIYVFNTGLWVSSDK